MGEKSKSVAGKKKKKKNTDAQRGSKPHLSIVDMLLFVVWIIICSSFPTEVSTAASKDRYWNMVKDELV